MNIQQLESFVQVAETLNFARAAEFLNITQSAVSRQIHSLEEELNSKLFYRTTKTVSLTPDGIIFLEHAKHILVQLRIATAKIQHHTNTLTYPLTIGCRSELELPFLSRLLSVCRNQIPSFHPIVKVIPSPSLINLFEQGEIEVLFGFRNNIPLKNDVSFTELCHVSLCCVLPATHPLAHAQELDEQTLFSENFILCSSRNIPSRAAELQKKIVHHIPPERIHASDNPQVILSLIQAGYGCSILPEMPFHDPSLAYIPLKNIPPMPYGILQRKEAGNPIQKQFSELALQTASCF